MTAPASEPHYQTAGWFTRNVFNKAVAGLTGLGISVLGSRILAVRGRKSGEWRTTPGKPPVIDGPRYLVAPRGPPHRGPNLRVAHTGDLPLGRGAEPFAATELTDDEKPAIL